MLKTLPNLGEDQAGLKTAGKEGRGIYWVQAKSNISSNSSSVQPSGGLTSPYFMFITSCIRGTLHLSMGFITWYLIWSTMLGKRSSTLVRFVMRRMFLRLHPEVVRTSSLTMPYSCLRTGLGDCLTLQYQVFIKMALPLKFG